MIRRTHGPLLSYSKLTIISRTRFSCSYPVGFQAYQETVSSQSLYTYPKGTKFEYQPFL